MKTKLQFGDAGAIRLLFLGEILQGVKEVIKITPEDDAEFWIYECPHCHDEDNFSEDLNDRHNTRIYICNSCGKKSAEKSIMDEFKSLKKQFK